MKLTVKNKVAIYATDSIISSIKHSQVRKHRIHLYTCLFFQEYSATPSLPIKEINSKVKIGSILSCGKHLPIGRTL